MERIKSLQSSEDFLSHVDTTGDCWEWLGRKDKDGYGATRYKGKLFHTHRLSYILFVGEIPAGLFVCHNCNNPGCVNPKHLRADTHSGAALNIQSSWNFND